MIHLKHEKKGLFASEIVDTLSNQRYEELSNKYEGPKEVDGSNID